MTVKDFFCNSDFEKVIPYLLKHGEKYRDSIPAFRKAFDIVRGMEPEPADDHEVYFKWSSEDYIPPYVYVHPGAFHDKPWSGIIGREVVIDEGIELDNIEHATALMLWELTFYGFTPSES
jgi:hypothetical protein